MEQDCRAAGTGPAPPAGDSPGFRHLMVPYRDAADYQKAVAGFVSQALDRGEWALVAVPGHKAPILEGLLRGSDPGRVAYADMSEIGRNPARIIPFVRAFLDRRPGEPGSYVGEPAWPGRTGAELLEATKHEALVNRAFHDAPVAILCPYDAGLPPGVLADAERTHPLITGTGVTRASPAYLGCCQMPASCEQPLPGPPPGARVLAYRDSLRELRALVAQCADEAGLDSDRAADLVLAVSEIAANTLRHTGLGGTLSVWRSAGEILCQIEDGGVMTDALAGRVRPAGGEPGGHGLWVVNQVCDLVEVRSRPPGTAIRLRMGLDRQREPPALGSAGGTRFCG